jgi:hypothetical protein
VPAATERRRCLELQPPPLPQSATASALKRSAVAVAYSASKMSGLHCDADTGSGIVALCSWAAHVLRSDASLSLPLASACSDGSISRCLEHLQTGRMYPPLPVVSYCTASVSRLDHMTYSCRHPQIFVSSLRAGRPDSTSITSGSGRSCQPFVQHAQRPVSSSSCCSGGWCRQPYCQRPLAGP